MTETTVTRADLSEAVYQEVGLSRNDSAALVETVLNEIVEALTRGQTEHERDWIFREAAWRLDLSLAFEPGATMGMPGQRSSWMPILPRKVLVFRASHVLKNKINRALGKSGARAPTGAPAAAGVEPKA